MKNNQQVKKQMINKTFLIWKMAIASAISWEIAKLAGSHHPYLAPISVILCLQTTINRSIQFSYQIQQMQYQVTLFHETNALIKKLSKS